MKSHIGGVLVAAASALAFTATPPQGPVPRVASATADNPVSTSATSAQQVPGMATDISLERPATVIITFSAETRLSQPPSFRGNGVVVGLQVDGIPLQPSVSYTGSLFYGAHAFTWTAPLDRGRHTVAAYWHVCEMGCTGVTAYVAGRQLTSWWQGQ